MPRLKISRKKTEYLRFCQEEHVEVVSWAYFKKSGQVTFKYLGSTVAEGGELDAEIIINPKIQSGWKHWRNMKCKGRSEQKNMDG